MGLITITFAFFWLLIPMIVVRLRIRRRCRQNKERYQKWLAEVGVAMIRPRPARKVRLEPIDPDEQVFFHEKGTLYVASDMETGRVRPLDAPPVGNMVSRPVGRPSDVAFPGHRHDGHVCQRTHCSFTNRRIVFAGKDRKWTSLLSSNTSEQVIEGDDGLEDAAVFCLGESIFCARLKPGLRNPQ